MNRKAIIFGVKGYKLSNKEKIFLKKSKPWGIIKIVSTLSRG